MEPGLRCSVYSCDVFGYNATLHDNGISPSKFKTGTFQVDDLRRELAAINVNNLVIAVTKYKHKI